MQQSRKQSCIPSRFWPEGGIYQVWRLDESEADAEEVQAYGPEDAAQWFVHRHDGRRGWGVAMRNREVTVCVKWSIPGHPRLTWRGRVNGEPVYTACVEGGTWVGLPLEEEG